VREGKRRGAIFFLDIDEILPFGQHCVAA
jgi:hypothetical protein